MTIEADAGLVEPISLPVPGVAMYDVELTTAPAKVSVRYSTSVRVNHLSDDIGARMDELYKGVSEAGLHPCGPPSIIYRERPATECPMAIELDVPVAEARRATSEGLAGTGMRLHASSTQLRVHTIHRGPYQRLGAAHLALNEWLAANRHFRATGPHRETYLLGPGDAQAPDEYRTDVSVPVGAA